MPDQGQQHFQSQIAVGKSRLLYCGRLVLSNYHHRAGTSYAMESSTSRAPSLHRLGAANPPYSIEIARGDILWLKPKSDCCVTRPFASIEMEDGCFDHPALILHADPQQATATILLVSKARKFHRYNRLFSPTFFFPI